VQAGEQQAEEGEGNVEEEKEPVDYRLYQALMRGGEEVASVLKEMTELVSALVHGKPSPPILLYITVSAHEMECEVGSSGLNYVCERERVERWRVTENL